MKIKVLSEFPFTELISKLRDVTLKNDLETKPYAHDRVCIELRSINPKLVRPVSAYVVQANLDFQRILRETLMREYNFDTLRMEKGYVIQFLLPRTEPRTLIPPIVEISHYDGGLPVIMDGLHRLYLALSSNEDINSILISRVVVPYYGSPLQKGWSELEVLPEAPLTKQKRNYRLDDPSIQYALYRDLEPLGVGRPRSQNEKEEITRLIKFLEEK
jgi:hypothetical protein